MTTREHRYLVNLTWTGASGTVPFRNHRRDYVLTAPNKPPIEGSSDSVFRGDRARWNPEDLLVAALSACHQLWYLGLCAAAGIEVLAYQDSAEGTMTEDTPGGAGRFTEVVLRPRVVLAAGADRAKAEALHQVAHEHCFVARSVNFPVRHLPSVSVEGSV